MSRKISGRRLSFESCEKRLCMTVGVAVEDGLLSVSGEADGQVDIVATGEGTFEVRDAGVTIDTVADVDAIDLRLDDTEANDDHQVTIDLGGHSVDRVFVDLGDGENVLTLAGGSIEKMLAYRGGDGGDAVALATDTVIEGGVLVRLGDGDNILTVGGTVGRSLFVHGGDGADTIVVEEGATLERGMSARLGDGGNRVTIAGQVSREVSVRGGADDDTVDILATAIVERSLSVALGGGENSLSLAGTIEGNVAYDGRDGNDTVTLEESAVVERSVDIRLGAGDNSVTHLGAIGGSLRVTSANEDDVVDISDREDAVGGRTQISLGEQATGRGHCGGPGGSRYGRALGNHFGFGRHR